MANAFTDIVAQLERQKPAIERALAALREIGGPVSESAAGRAPVTAKTRATRKAKRKTGITAEGRARLAEAMRARWAAKKAASKRRGA